MTLHCLLRRTAEEKEADLNPGVPVHTRQETRFVMPLSFLVRAEG
jgi:hypothetical protein